MILGGTDTTYVAMEWVMAELIRHSEQMELAQQEGG
jgi:cytochrome P450